MYEHDLDYHLHHRPKEFQAQAEHERLINRLKKEAKRRKRKPRIPRETI